jgi:hypothetical protein
MDTLQLSAVDFDQAVRSSSTLVVEFVVGEGHRPPHPLAHRFPAVTFAHVDPVREPGVAAMFGLSREPALVVFKEQVVVYLERGAHPVEQVAALLDRISGLDMVKIREEIDRERAEVAVHMRRLCPAARRGPVPG